MSFNTSLDCLLDQDVILYIGTQGFNLKGTIGEKPDDEIDVVVLHTEAGMTKVRLGDISAYTVFPYVEQHN